MNNERFFNAYVELLTSTLHDALNKNIVFQTQAKIVGEDQEELKSVIRRLESELEKYKDVGASINQKDTEINYKTVEINRLKEEFEQIKSETEHLNTFRNELVVARKLVESKEKQLKSTVSKYEKEIEKLKEKIKNLQTSTKNRKKMDNENVENPEELTEINDGGSF